MHYVPKLQGNNTGLGGHRYYVLPVLYNCSYAGGVTVVCSLRMYILNNLVSASKHDYFVFRRVMI